MNNRIPPIKSVHVGNPDDDFAQVCLFKWQHGHLPGENSKTEPAMHPSAGLRNMADAIENGVKSGDLKNMPTPYEICIVLKYAAKIISDLDNKKKK